MQKTTLALMMTSLLFATSACQPKAKTSETSPTAVQEIKQESPTETLEPKITTGLALDAQTCINLSRTIDKVDSNSEIEAIHSIQKQLSACLPTADNAEVMALLKSYQAMYNRFLASDLDSDSDYETFNSAIYELCYGDGLSSAQLKTLTPRDQYLFGLVKSDADVSIYDEGEGFFSFTHNLKTMADIFTPYLRKDQRLFIQRMAIDNQNTFWNDASVTVSFEELIERALFWENYIQQYPDGYEIKDAKYLLDFYRYIIFFGAENTQWTDDAIREFIDPKDEQAIQLLAKRSNSILAEDAQNLLDFMALSDSKRQKKYPVPSKDDNGNKIDDWEIPRYQLTEALQKPLPWENKNNRDCLSGIICVDYNFE